MQALKYKDLKQIITGIIVSEFNLDITVENMEMFKKIINCSNQIIEVVKKYKLEN